MVQNINLVKQIRFLFITFLIIIFSSSNSYTNEICDSFVIDNLNKNIINRGYDPVVEYNEIRNDSGIFFDHQWNKKEQQVVLRKPHSERSRVLRKPRKNTNKATKLDRNLILLN